MSYKKYGVCGVQKLCLYLWQWVAIIETFYIFFTEEDFISQMLYSLGGFVNKLSIFMKWRGKMPFSP